uniref:Epsin 2 n=1 Tax=Homo sapiens TaxID=9606 RepID=J3QQJ8_HUMAN
MTSDYRWPWKKAEGTQLKFQKRKSMALSHSRLRCWI